MSENIVYLVTGANRGIGSFIAGKLLQRPNVTVIATARKPTTDRRAAHPTSIFIHFLLDEADPAISSATLADRLKADHGIDRIDVVIANAGSSSGFKSILDTDPEADLLYDFTVNAVGPVKLFRATWPLLERGRETKFVLIGSSVGSIGALEQESFPSTAYGMSKAAANWFAKKASVEFREKGLLVLVVHPGWVKTPLGQALADAVNFKEPPMEEIGSAEAVIDQIDKLTPEKSGKFLLYDGTELPW